MGWWSLNICSHKLVEYRFQTIVVDETLTFKVHFQTKVSCNYFYCRLFWFRLQFFDFDSRVWPPIAIVCAVFFFNVHVINTFAWLSFLMISSPPQNFIQRFLVLQIQKYLNTYPVIFMLIVNSLCECGSDYLSEERNKEWKYNEKDKNLFRNQCIKTTDKYSVVYHLSFLKMWTNM